MNRFKHYRLVFNKYARPFDEFEDVKELLTAVFADALQAHEEAYEKVHILHRNISYGNIMIDKHGRGLIDWDLSKSTTDQGVTVGLPERTGTWQFIAYRLLHGPRIDSGMIMPTGPLNKDDDLESFWHVMFWLALRNCEHSMDSDSVEYTMKQA